MCVCQVRSQSNKCLSFRWSCVYHYSIFPFIINLSEGCQKHRSALTNTHVQISGLTFLRFGDSKKKILHFVFSLFYQIYLHVSIETPNCWCTVCYKAVFGQIIIYRIRPNYRTVRLGFSNLQDTLICGQICIYLLRIHYKKDQKRTYLMMTMRFFLTFFTKAYVVGTHLNCINLLMQSWCSSNEYPQHMPL